MALDIIYFTALVLNIMSYIVLPSLYCWESPIKGLLEGPHATQMGRLSVSPHAVAQGQFALSSWKMGKTASTSIPYGAVSRVGILELLLG